MEWLNSHKDLKAVDKTAWQDMFKHLEKWEREERFNETYNGTYRTREAFAETLADDIGAVDNSATNGGWPMGCIDWTVAADELEHDYDFIEDIGYVHVFRIY